MLLVVEHILWILHCPHVNIDGIRGIADLFFGPKLHMNMIYRKKRATIDILFVTLVTNDELLEISTMLHVKYYEEHEMKVRVYQQYMHSV